MRIDVFTKESFYVEDGRLYEILSRAYSIAAKDQDSWTSLFKTKAYKKRQNHVTKLFAHVHFFILERYMKENGLDWGAYEIKRCGSNRRTDVIYKRNQYYEVIKLK